MKLYYIIDGKLKNSNYVYEKCKKKKQNIHIPRVG